MFLNYSNHPSSDWEDAQLAAAEKYGQIEDLPFPRVSPRADIDEIVALAHEQARFIAEMHPAAVMCQGEMTLVYHLVRLLKEMNIPVLCACTERASHAYPLANGITEKRSQFRFVRFREY